jgi:hypothetical protein
MKLMGGGSIVSVGMGLRMIVLNREMWGDFGVCLLHALFLWQTSCLGMENMDSQQNFVVSMGKIFVSYIFLTLFVFLYEKRGYGVFERQPALSVC